MTPEHIFFIPTILMIGFFAGAIFTPYLSSLGDKLQLVKKQTTGPQSLEPPSVSGRFVLGALIAFIAVFIATHVFPAPNSVVAVMKINGGLPLFDQSPSFSNEEVYQRLIEYGQEGRDIYKRFVFTTDLIFPLTFFVLLVSLARFVGERTTVPIRYSSLLVVLPIIWLLSDIFENILTFTLISQFPRPTNIIGGFIGYVTVIKFSLLFLSLFLPLVVYSLFRSQATKAPCGRV